MSKGLVAKVKIYSKEAVGDGQVTLQFSAPYMDTAGNRINEEWAKYTPALHITMTVIDSVAEGLEIGQPYTLTFAPEE